MSRTPTLLRISSYLYACSITSSPQSTTFDGRKATRPPLLGSLVDLCQETPKHLFLHPASLLIDRLDQSIDALIRVFFVRLEPLRDGDGGSGEDLLDTGLARRVLSAVVFLLVSLRQDLRKTADIRRELSAARGWRA